MKRNFVAGRRLAILTIVAGVGWTLVAVAAEI